MPYNGAVMIFGSDFSSRIVRLTREIRPSQDSVALPAQAGGMDAMAGDWRLGALDALKMLCSPGAVGAAAAALW